MRKLIVLTLLFMAAIGCKPAKKAPENASPKSAIIAERVEGASPWKVALALDPAQPANGKREDFRFTITDASGRPATGLDVNVGLVMPLMDMGKNEFPAREVAPGVYQGTGTFSMDEEWEVFVKLQQGDKKATHIFNVRVAE